MLASTPNKDGTTTVLVDYHYYLPRKKRLYYQHHEGYDAAQKAADEFLARSDARYGHISHRTWHEADRQVVMAEYIINR